MTQQEFQHLTGMSITEEEFKCVNMMYMFTDEITKEFFCEQFSRLQLIKLVRAWVALESDLAGQTAESGRLQAKLQTIKAVL